MKARVLAAVSVLLLAAAPVFAQGQRRVPDNCRRPAAKVAKPARRAGNRPDRRPPPPPSRTRR